MMKKPAFFSVLIFITAVCVAQITSADLTDSITIERIYLGFDTKTNLKPNDISNRRSISIQTGVMLRNEINSTLKIRSYGALLFRSNKPLVVLSAYEAIFAPIKKINIIAGVTSTPTTELRPNPTTWQSQTETNAQSKIIGGRYGLKFRYHLGSSIISYGVFNHNGFYVHHLKFDFGKIKIAGYSELGSLFLALNYQTKFFEMTTIYSQNKEVATSLFFNGSNKYSFFMDSELDLNTQKLTKMEVGYRKYYNGIKVPLRGFFSLSYDPFFGNKMEGRFIIHL